MNNQDNDNESIIDDLAAQNTEAIKGGPTPQNKRTFVLQSSVEGGVAEVQTITVAGLASNHNETIVLEEVEEDAAETARLTDLTLSEVQRDEVKGGMLLPAVQKVREAAARLSSSGMSAGKVTYSDLS